MSLFPDEHDTIEGVGQALRAGRTTCAEVFARCLDRIDEREPRIRAWVVVDRERAAARARALDSELAEGRCRGPLHGIPIGVKDIIDVAGLPTAAGFSPWKDRVAARDAPLVSRLLDAGAVVLGKTVTTQFAWIDPPPTRNPWDLERTPGGSSSGSAAAVAGGMCLGAIGTQTGGSILRPASFCGVAGFKPSFRDEPWAVEGIVPFAPCLDHPGPIARTVRDLTLIFRGAFLRLDDAMHADAEPPAPPRLGRLRGFFDRRAIPDMSIAIDRAAALLADAGAELIDVADPVDFEHILEHHRVIMAAEAAEGHGRRLEESPDDYRPRIRALIGEGLAVPATRYKASRDHQESLRRRGLQVMSSGRLDALLMPAAVGPAPDPSTTGDPAFNSPWSYMGTPAVSFPIGLSPDGLPLAIQLVDPGGSSDHVVDRGLFSRDLALLETARWCEDVLRGARSA